MNIFKVLKGTAEEVKLNPNIGTFSWILHRLSGLMLLAYLFAHMWVLGSAQSGSETFNERLKLVQSPIFHFLEIGLIIVIFYHMVNGIAISVMDFCNISRQHKTVVTITVVVVAILAIIAIAVMLPRALYHVPTGGIHAIS